MIGTVGSYTAASSSVGTEPSLIGPIDSVLGSVHPLSVVYRLVVDRKSRRGRSVSISSTTATRKYSCVCGASETESAKYRQTNRVFNWCLTHEGCMAKKVAAAVENLTLEELRRKLRDE